MTNAIDRPALFAKATADDWAREEWIGELSPKQRHELEGLLQHWRMLMGAKLQARRAGVDPWGWLPFGKDPSLIRLHTYLSRYLDDLRQAGIKVNGNAINDRVYALYRRIEQEAPAVPKIRAPLQPSRHRG